MMMRHRSTILFVALSLLCVVLFALDMTIGDMDISVGEVFSILAGGDADAVSRGIVIDIRLVKAVMAILAGAALSVSGLQMQTLFHNPMAGPYTLGISSGASLGVALFILGAPLGLTSSAGLSTFGIAGPNAQGGLTT